MGSSSTCHETKKEDVETNKEDVETKKEKKAKKENIEAKKQEEKEVVGLTPQEVNELLLQNANLNDQVSNLKKENRDLKIKLENYEKTANGQIQNISRAATMNMTQALTRIDFLQRQNNVLINERNNLQSNWNYLNIENNKLKFYNYKMQLMLLNQMQNTPMNDNIMAAKTLNTPQGNVNMNNMNNNKKNSMNFNSPSFNYEKNKNMITIVFNIDNKIKCNISALPNHKLGNIFLLALYQNGYSNFININDFSFRYSTHNITNLFRENKEISAINTISNSLIVIDVSGGNF